MFPRLSEEVTPISESDPLCLLIYGCACRSGEACFGEDALMHLSTVQPCGYGSYLFLITENIILKNKIVTVTASNTD